jgi:hypothetical protein
MSVGPRKPKAMLVSPASEPALDAGKRIGDEDPARDASHMAAMASTGPSALVTTTATRSCAAATVSRRGSTAFAVAVAVIHAAGSA